MQYWRHCKINYSKLKRKTSVSTIHLTTRLSAQMLGNKTLYSRWSITSSHWLFARMFWAILQNVRISLLWFSLILLVGTQKEDYHCVSVNICLNFQPIFRNTFTARTWQKKAILIWKLEWLEITYRNNHQTCKLMFHLFLYNLALHFSPYKPQIKD